MSQRAAQPIPPVVYDVLRSPGQPLDARARVMLERGFGHDFSRVRIHTDARAAESTRAVDALAYTVGSDVVFGAGKYAPGTADGQRLLAHEMTHVIQQAGAPAGAALTLGQPGDPLEREADHVADRMSTAADSTGRPVSAGVHGAAPVLQRQTSGGNVAQKQREARLRLLVARPADAIHAWKKLTQADRDWILWEMIGRYGADFAADFLSYATGKKKPRDYVTVSNPPAGKPAPQPPEPEAPDDRQTRCADPCRDSTDDEDACHKCCEETIPADDVPCRRTCDITCTMKL